MFWEHYGKCTMWRTRFLVQESHFGKHTSQFEMMTIIFSKRLLSVMWPHNHCSISSFHHFPQYHNRDQCPMLWCSEKRRPLLCKTKGGPPLEGTKCGDLQVGPWQRWRMRERKVRRRNQVHVRPHPTTDSLQSDGKVCRATEWCCWLSCMDWFNPGC